MRRSAEALQVLRQFWVFPLVITWKLLLIGVFSLPVPANDAYFFDGAIMHWLLHGSYVNPTIEGMFPTSATEVFSAYPPGYQGVLALWMMLFGPTVQSSMWLHGVLFSVSACLVLGILRRLGVTAAAANLGACFLFGVTFHDRPDSVAHVCGLLAFWFWSAPSPGARGWRWLAGGCLIVLTLATSLHIGAMYAAILWGYAALRAGSEGWPWRSMALMVVAPLLLAAAVVLRYPVAWQGFQENLLVTPSFTGLRWPTFDEILKVARNAPGIIAVVGLLGLRTMLRQPLFRPEATCRPAVQTLVAFGAGLAFAVAANLFLVHPNYIMVVLYGQALIVALWWHVRAAPPSPAWRPLRLVLPAAASLVALRAIGLSTWGVAASVDVPRDAAAAQVREALAGVPDGSQVVVSSALLYDLATERRWQLMHSDWTTPRGVPHGFFRPELFLLTPFDFARRYEPALQELAQAGQLQILEIKPTHQVVLPEDTRRLRRVVQHLSWAPVVVRVRWLR